MINTKILIIGAGPAGLAIAGRLRQLSIPFEIIEKSQQVGASWIEHYDRLHLHTVKELSHLPFLPFPEDYPLYVPRLQLLAYFEQYAKHFDIQPLFGMEATAIQRSDDKWLVKTAKGIDFLCEKVVLATGLNRIPNRPAFSGEAQFKGTIIHSKAYKNADRFAGQTVLVVGMGNTGAEIALDLCENGIETFLSVRGAVNVVPRDTFAGPTQRTALKLAKLPNWIGDPIGVLLRRLTVGDLSKYGLPTPKMPPAKQLRTTGKTPVIDIGTIDHIKVGNIKVLPGIAYFDDDAVAFTNGEKRQFDAVILATGYSPKIEELLEDTRGLLDPYGLPKNCIAEGKHKGLYFLGFDNYVAGGILGVIYRDSEQIAKNIAQEMKGQ